jgi:hypothetical protein
MAINYTNLQSEITNDPLQLGYSGKSDKEKAALLNLKTGPGAGSINNNQVEKSVFLITIAPALLVLATKDDATKDKWDRILHVIESVSTVTVSSVTIQTILAVAKLDGLINDATIAAITTRTGSRAEVLFGENVVISESDIGTARNGV